MRSERDTPLLMVRGSPNPRHLRLPSRLRKARKQSGLTRMALAQTSGVSTPTALYVETGQQIPTVGTIARLAAALSVSAAWLGFGIGEQSTDNKPVACDNMGARLQAARIEQNHTKASLARLAELNPGSIAGIESGGQAGVDTVEQLAKALHISPAWLAYGIGPQILPSRRRSRSIAGAA